MSEAYYSHLTAALAGIEAAGLYKRERLIATPQSSDIEVSEDGQTREVINFCANNYLGLANSPEIIRAAQKAMDEFGYGMASVRFICGTQTLHRDLEKKIASFLRRRSIKECMNLASMVGSVRVLSVTQELKLKYGNASAHQRVICIRQ